MFAFTSDIDGDSEIFLRRGDGPILQITRDTASDHGVSWSPDGRRLAFVSSRDGDAEIYTMNADGTGVRQLTRNSRTASGMPIHDQAPAWSPTGQYIAFVSNRDGGEYKIYRMNADGSRQVRLTSGSPVVTDHTPSWSPGGHYIVFNSDRHGYDNVEIYRMRVNGTELRRLTTTPAGVDDNAPQYSPDGRSIAFTSNRSGTTHDVWIMGADGTRARKVAADPGLDDVLPRWAPNGRSLVYSTLAGPEGKPSEDVWAVDGTDRRRIFRGPGTNHSRRPDRRCVDALKVVAPPNVPASASPQRVDVAVAGAFRCTRTTATSTAARPATRCVAVGNFPIRPHR